MSKPRKPGCGINKKGRSKNDSFIMLRRNVLRSEAYRFLSCVGRSLLILVWERHNGFNNGRIGLSHREAREALRVGNGKVQSGFRELQETEFLIARQKGSFNCKVRHATEWEITTEACDGEPAKRLYLKYRSKK